MDEATFSNVSVATQATWAEGPEFRRDSLTSCRRSSP
jgi:hypothetical protein